MKLPLTISLLASSRITSLERCLDSLKPLLQQVPAELIVVFTGTDERVRQVAARYTDQIIPFTWCNDFSAARNAGLIQAKGEWFLYIDDDEWFEDVSEICDFFSSGEYKHYHSASYIQRNYTDWSGEHYTDYPALRMVRRMPETIFNNPIHEELIPHADPCKLFHTYVHHYGYIKDTPLQKSEKASRNIPMLLKELEEHPDYIKNHLQLTQEYCVEGKWNEAEAACRNGRRLCRQDDGTNCQQWFQVYLIDILYQKKAYEQAKEEAQGILQKEHPCELARLDLYLRLISLCDMQESFTEVLHYGKELEQLLAYMDAHSELWFQQMCGDLTRERIKTPKRLYPARLNCIKSAMELSKWEQAEFFLKLLPWEEEHMLELYYPLLDQWTKAYEPYLNELLMKLPQNSSYLLYQQLLYEEKNGNKESALFIFHRCLKEIEHPYLQRQLVKKALLEKRDLSSLLIRIDLDSWKNYISGIVEEIPYEENQILWESLESDLSQYPLHSLWLKKLLLERQLFRGFLMKEVLLQALKDYAECIKDFYQAQYQEIMFQETSLHLLPADCRMALTILAALEHWKQGKLAETLRLFRQVLQIYPQMTGVIREILRFLTYEASNPPAASGTEFEQLALQMKAVLRAMIENRQYAEAMQVLGQLIPLLPNDMELLKLQQQLLTKIN